MGESWIQDHNYGWPGTEEVQLSLHANSVLLLCAQSRRWGNGRGAGRSNRPESSARCPFETCRALTETLFGQLTGRQRATTGLSKLKDRRESNRWYKLPCSNIQGMWLYRSWQYGQIATSHSCVRGDPRPSLLTGSWATSFWSGCEKASLQRCPDFATQEEMQETLRHRLINRCAGTLVAGYSQNPCVYTTLPCSYGCHHCSIYSIPSRAHQCRCIRLWHLLGALKKWHQCPQSESHSGLKGSWRI